MKILFVAPSLHGGGAERVLVNLVRYFSECGFAIQLATFDSRGTFRNELPDSITLHDLNLPNHRDPRRILRVADLIRKAKPEVVLSIMRNTNLVSILAREIAGASPAMVISEHSNPVASFEWFGGGWYKGLGIRLLYPRADAVVAVSEGVASVLKERWSVPADKIHVIRNPVDIDRIERLSREPVPHPWFSDLGTPVIIGVGRLHALKDFALLLRAFERIRRKRHARLVILGEGPERAELERKADELGIQDDLLMPGFQSNPFAWLARSSVFVLSSRYEGLSNVIIEAMASGCPVVSTDCPFGPGEIIQDGVSGLLVPVGDEQALEQAIERVLDDSHLRDDLIEGGRKRAQDFSIERVGQSYENLLRRLVK